MEEILLFLASSITSGAVGHYVSRGLSKIDSELPTLLQNEADMKKIENIIESKGISDEVVEFARHMKTEIKNERIGNVVNFSGGSNYGVVANKVEFKNTKKQVRVEAPAETIASSVLHRNYVKRLIDRYHEYKKAEIDSSKMNYAVFYQAINREFGAKWDFIPLGRFEELVRYLQGRIDKTILGKNNRARDIKSYSTFEEYVAKYG